ncbi:hypothetical protein [Streptomyces sp. NPDC006879]|uniref:hypothetical protein n=1 Tax=Streptomyces sp. NPDC006879 TaxID=3364767 RepID=UPI0036894B34
MITVAPPRALCARTALRIGALLMVGAFAGACGIRATTVPIDVGPAPSRVSCDMPSGGGAQSAEGFRVGVQLVCGAQLVQVVRVVTDEGRAGRDRLRLAQALLAELEQVPAGRELEAGFSTGVPTGLYVTPGRSGDPEGTVRLSRKPEDLPALALAQIVCTFAGNGITDAKGPVVLGGPDSDPPRAWECTDAVRARPEAVPTLGEIVRPTASASRGG